MKKQANSDFYQELFDQRKYQEAATEADKAERQAPGTRGFDTLYIIMYYNLTIGDYEYIVKKLSEIENTIDEIEPVGRYTKDDILLEYGEALLELSGPGNELKGSRILQDLYTNTKSNEIKYWAYVHLDRFGYRPNENIIESFKKMYTGERPVMASPANFSQCGQDVFALMASDPQKYQMRRSYLEFGAASPIINSNTLLLENMMWKGSSFEIDMSLYLEFRTRRRNPIYKGDVFTKDINAIVKKMGCLDFSPNLPASYRFIDYVQFDIDPPENTFKLLTNFLDSGIKAGTVTFEHDRYYSGNEVVDESRSEMKKHGYELMIANVAPCPEKPFEDWYIHKDYGSPWTRKIIDRDYVTVPEIFY